MDNLDLSASEISDGLKITAVSRNRCYYSCVIVDFAACQDKPVFSDRECAKFIKDNIKLAEYKFGDHVVDVVIRTTHVTVSFTLEHRVHDVPLLESIIDNLTARLDSLEEYRTIHECYYPEWNSLDELKKLPHYQCIEDSCELYKFTVPLPNFDGVSGRRVLSYDGVFYTFDGMMYIDSPNHVVFCNVGSYPKSLSQRDLVVNENRSTIGPGDSLRKLFNMSHEPCYKFGIGSAIKFIGHYVAAWVMKNFHLVAGRNPMIELVGDTEKRTLLIRIKRLKRRQCASILVKDINGVTLVDMPIIRCTSCVIDDIELVQKR